MRPSAPSQPLPGAAKHTVWTLGGAGSRRQCCPPSVVVSRTPPTTGVPPETTPPDTGPPATWPPATANPTAGLMKCTVRSSGHGSGSCRHFSPLSAVARMVDAPTTQPWLESTKSTELSRARAVVRYSVSQCRPPSSVPRIRSGPTTQPVEPATNCTPPSSFRAPGAAGEGTPQAPGLRVAGAVAPPGELAAAGDVLAVWLAVAAAGEDGCPSPAVGREPQPAISRDTAVATAGRTSTGRARCRFTHLMTPVGEWRLWPWADGRRLPGARWDAGTGR